MPSLPAYVVVTPARNEAQFIELTIQSVVAQEVLPLKWVIVSDGSTDGTDEIVARYAAQHPWIELLRMAERRERHFAGKAYAIHAGVARLMDLPFQALACLDADITFESGYFAFLLDKLVQDPKLGIAGTPYVDTTSETYDFRYVSLEHVSGACQLFRRACWEQIGGYVAAKGGAIDTIAVVSARMKGWKTRTFTEKHSQHHRELGTAQGATLQARFVLGCRDYAMGNHPLWELSRVLYQMGKKPYLLRALAIAAGYLRSSMGGVERPVSKEFVSFIRREQMQRLRRRFLPAHSRGISQPGQ
jgi:glycosyltransferase involved in cell wall biosynthesis